MPFCQFPFLSGHCCDSFHGISDADTFFLLSQAKERCSGTTRKGIEALALKCRGHTGVEIAARYGVAPNHVAALGDEAVPDDHGCKGWEGSPALHTVFLGRMAERLQDIFALPSSQAHIGQFSDYRCDCLKAECRRVLENNEYFSSIFQFSA